MNQSIIYVLVHVISIVLAKKDYKGYKVTHLKLETEHQVEYFRNLYLNDHQLQLDFWKLPTKRDTSCDVMFPPKTATKVFDLLEQLNITYNVAVEDVQKSIDRETEVAKFSKSLSRDAVFNQNSNLGMFNFGSYHSYDEISSLMDVLNRQYPDITEVLQLGLTWDKRPIKALKVGNRYRSAEANRPIFWIDGGIHAREWIAPAVATYAMNELVTKYGSDNQIKHFVDQMDWVIVPVINPDGYEYSRNQDRMWRKNRNPNGKQRFNWCWGVDLNRNFDWFFGGEGSSFDPCQEIYAGQTPFSEPESAAVRNYVLNNKDRIKAFITLHSFSQIWMYPYGHEYNKRATDWKDLKKVASKASQKLKSYYGTEYIIDTGANSLYPAAGGSDDWTKGKANIKFVYLIELRPSDNSPDAVYGFLLPENQISPTCLETWAGFQEVAKEVLTFTHRPAEPNPITYPIYTLAPTQPSIIQQPINQCTDKEPYCSWWASLGACHAWRSDMRLSCPKSCGICNSVKQRSRNIPKPNLNIICNDKRKDCAAWVRMSLCDWVTNSCQRSCSLC